MTTTIESHPDRSTWLAARRRGLGASDAAAVLGISTYKSPFALWAEKTGQVADDDLSAVECVEWGNRLQGPIIEAYRERSGRTVQPVPEFQIVRRQGIDFAFASLDATQTITTKTPDQLVVVSVEPVEAKNVNEYMRGEWDDEPPLAFQIQLQHQIGIAGADRGTLVALIGGQRLKWFDQPRNDKFISALFEQEAAFWDLVVRGIPPQVDGTAATAACLAKLWPRDNGTTVSLPGGTAYHLDRWLKAAALRKRIEDVEEEAKAQLKLAIGEATFGILPDGRELSLKTQTVAEHVRKESTFRVLRLVKAKEAKAPKAKLPRRRKPLAIGE